MLKWFCSKDQHCNLLVEPDLQSDQLVYSYKDFLRPAVLLAVVHTIEMLHCRQVDCSNYSLLPKRMYSQILELDMQYILRRLQEEHYMINPCHNSQNMLLQLCLEVS